MSERPAKSVRTAHQIARVLVDSLASDGANRLTFELVAEHGLEQEDLEPVFAALDKGPVGSFDGVRDQANMPAGAEPERVRRDIGAFTTPN
ncbi:hypothetical protein [Arthrobacter sp. ZGTC412]|uniref:hypothetical protein n=1 Tax=Arthrobacter sp. ZGTC412 TaxID=2058900 RepID=UPI001CA47F9D|nr:hypothetical protein [Arthrobacter sp. ZGTC412]